MFVAKANVGAVLLNLYDPIKLAEDMIVLDLIAQGRVSFTIGLGYRPEEYAMFGAAMAGRGKLIEGKLDALLRALRGETFEYEGRPVNVTPRPHTEGGPMVAYGGQSPAAARRAGRFGLNFLAGGGDASLADIYEQAAKDAGHTPGMAVIPDGVAPTTLYVARDVDRAWQKIGPFMLHDAKMYAAWMGPKDRSASKSDAQTVDDLRAENGPYRIVTPAQAVEMIRAGQPLPMQPLSGGCPPEYAWESLRLITDEVMPAV